MSPELAENDDRVRFVAETLHRSIVETMAKLVASG